MMIYASMVDKGVEKMNDTLPIAVIGAGPVGLAAAAHLLERGLEPIVFERGPAVGTALDSWGHVRVFSPWRYNIDAAARRLLEQRGWNAPEPDALPTGAELVGQYLAPLAAHPTLAPRLRLGSAVTRIARQGHDKASSNGRADAPFVVRWRNGGSTEESLAARAVIDASGTWFGPNPMGADGLAVPGEAEAADRIAYGLPDVLGTARADYAGMRVLVVGGGHSAVNDALDLLQLRRTAPATRVLWALRRDNFERLLGGGLNDELPARGALGLAAKRAIESGSLELLAPFAASRIERTDAGLRVHARIGDEAIVLEVDRIVVATGFRPDHELSRELRVALDPIVEAPPALAPLIDPNLHSCGTVPPHGAAELAHPEPGFYIVGSKSYGRAPTFLMLTGYEQVRSVAAALAGDAEAARRVELVLPETGACSGPAPELEAAAGCCGGPAPTGVDACCVRDADAKAAGAAGCGCGTPEAVPEVVPVATAGGCCGPRR
jgi:thioredoxin reductase